MAKFQTKAVEVEAFPLIAIDANAETHKYCFEVNDNARLYELFPDGFTIQAGQHEPKSGDYVIAGAMPDGSPDVYLCPSHVFHAKYIESDTVSKPLYSGDMNPKREIEILEALNRILDCSDRAITSLLPLMSGSRNALAESASILGTFTAFRSVLNAVVENVSEGKK